jgi:hypothetical protein
MVLTFEKKKLKKKKKSKKKRDAREYNKQRVTLKHNIYERRERGRSRRKHTRTCDDAPRSRRRRSSIYSRGFYIYFTRTYNTAEKILSLSLSLSPVIKRKFLEEEEEEEEGG